MNRVISEKGCSTCAGRGICPEAFSEKAHLCNDYDHFKEELQVQPVKDDPRKMFPYEHEMTVGELKQFLEAIDPELPVMSSIFRPMNGLIYKKVIKFSQCKVGRGCVYINSYLDK